MAAIFVKGLIALFLAFVTLIGVVQAGRSAPDTLNQVFVSECEEAGFGLCFLGIHLGETPLTEAREMLEHHTWVTSVNAHPRYDPYNVAYLNFRWRDPDLSDRALWGGELITPVNTVDGIRLESEMTLGDLWMALGEPTIVVHNRQPGSRGASRLVYYLFYSENALAIANMPACPITFRGFLMSSVYALELREAGFATAQEQRNVVENVAQLLRELRANSEECE